MNALLNFPPSILCFLGVIVFAVIIVGLFLKTTPLNRTLQPYWLNRCILLALVLALVWVIRIYPTQESILLAGHFLWNPLTALLSASLLGLSLPVFIYAEDGFEEGETASQDYYILGLLSLFGGLAMLTAGSVLAFYLGLEMMSIASYGMVGLASKEGLRIEASMKYIIMGILSSTLLLYGFCLFYFIEPNLALGVSSHLYDTAPLLAQIAASLLLLGLLFKLGAVPFHFWVPDVYQGTSMPTTLFIATIPKFAAIGMGLRLFLDRMQCLTVNACLLLLGIGLLSTVVGNLMTLMQVNLRRLLAYSSIAHMGFILLGFALPLTHYSTVLFYGFTYCLMSTLLFGVLAHLERTGLKINTVQDLKGLSTHDPMAALLILLVMSAMAGIPPLIGFFSKFGILYSLLKQDFYVPAGVALITTVVGAYYYLNIIKSMYFDEPDERQRLPQRFFNMRQITLVCSGIILIGLSISPGILLDVIEKNIAFKALSIEKMDRDVSHHKKRGSVCD